jgi:hypothetical protein
MIIILQGFLLFLGFKWEPAICHFSNSCYLNGPWGLWRILQTFLQYIMNSTDDMFFDPDQKLP